jgi:hypothetical protein
MKVLLGSILTIIVLLTGLSGTALVYSKPSGKVISSVYEDGILQGIHDYIHKHDSSPNDNPTGNLNITKFQNAYSDGWNWAISGPWGAPNLHFNKKSMDYTDGWITGRSARIHDGFPKEPLGHNSDSYNQGFHSGYYYRN